MTSSQQTVFRAEHHSNYTVICNESLRDERLSLKARSMLTLCVGLSKDWNFSVAGLTKFFNCSKDTVSKFINELIKYGYAVREQIREQGRIIKWVTRIYERPNLDSESTDTRSLFSRSGKSRSGKQGHIESKDQTNYVSEKVNIKTPPTSSEVEQQEEIKINAFLGIKSNSQSLTAFGSMLHSLEDAIAHSLGQLSAAPSVEKPKINPPDCSVDTQAPKATASVLRKLSEITKEGVESLRTNLGLQRVLERYPQNIEGVLDYLETECKAMKVGVGLVVTALSEGRKPQRLGGARWGEWIRKAERAGLIRHTESLANDIGICFNNGATTRWSVAQTWSWEEVEARATEDAF